jgi:hypothetical protein
VDGHVVGENDAWTADAEVESVQRERSIQSRRRSGLGKCERDLDFARDAANGQPETAGVAGATAMDLSRLKFHGGMALHVEIVAAAEVPVAEADACVDGGWIGGSDNARFGRGGRVETHEGLGGGEGAANGQAGVADLERDGCLVDAPACVLRAERRG